MAKILLRDITKVYRFGIQAQSWEREAGQNSHFLAYKLHGFTLHESEGSLLPFARDMLMVAHADDHYRVLSHEMERDGFKGGCIAVHFTTLEPFDLHLAIYDCSRHPQIKSDFFKLLDAWNQYQSSKHSGSEYACISCFYSILSRMFLIIDPETQHSSDKLTAAREYLNRNFADSTLSISAAADNAGMGQRRFGELFFQRYHITPGKYLTSCRIAAAVKLLQQEHLSIAEIASLTGYSSANYFIRVFRQEMGISPHAYRRQK